MASVPADAKRGFFLVIGALVALWVAAAVQARFT